MDEQEFLALREQKQQFLINEIIGGGHDPAQFKEYLDNLKPDGGSNVDVWTMDELVEVVKCFTTGEQPNLNTENQQQEQPSYNHPEEETKVEEHFKQEEQIPFEKPKPRTMSEIKNEDDTYVRCVKCQAVNRSPLNDETDAEIYVGDPELIKGGLFTPSYIVYKVTTKPFMWIVKRRFSDFFWLRAHLTKMYPNLMIPPIPKKKNKGKFENEFISRRMAFLEKFMNSCLQNEELKADQFFLAFVQMDDEKKWKAKTKVGDSLKRPAKLEETEKLDGEMVMKIGPDLKEFAQHATEFVYQSEPLYKKMRKFSKQLLLDFDQISNTLFNMGECFGQMYQVSNNFNKHSPMGQNYMLDDIYLTLNNLMVSWGEQMLGEMKIVQQGLSNFFKYSHSEFEPMREALKQRTTLATEFMKFKRALDAKKEKSFVLGEVSKWDIPSDKLKQMNQADLLKDKEYAFTLMFPKETAQEHDMRDKFAYFNFETFSEFSAGISKKCKDYLKNFQQFAKDQSENLSSVHIHWADGLAHFADANLLGQLKTGGLKDRTNVAKPEFDEKLLAGADAD
eukprot:CAMPEP_0176409234 /NCGR_PEP_ID=MMETSP0127-20121128/2388_1 /TAXON_ID=938130 /ORGANISM="Platyophrya macrostoma, Strain WH" /LENGTH=561 /DNA_ID=CAMNT_0017788597 /DNA_START=47 /DNA_END=1732 /DNA_ORIENTATION=-